MTRGAARATRERVVSAATSAKLREIMRLNVTHAAGTGRRAEAEGYRVGGKTGTAEMPGRGGYQEKAVISSFVGAFPMDAPQYVTLVLLFEPQTGEDGAASHHGRAQCGARRRRASSSALRPLLGVLPRLVEAQPRRPRPFDAPPAGTIRSNSVRHGDCCEPICSQREAIAIEGP